MQRVNADFDMKRLLAGHDIVYTTPPRHVRDALPIGNGRFGALVYQPDHWEWVVEKLDVEIDDHKDHKRDTDPTRFVINDHRVDQAIPYSEKLKAVKARNKAKLDAIRDEQGRRVRPLAVMPVAPTSLPNPRFRINVLPAWLQIHGDPSDVDTLHHRLDLYRGEVVTRTRNGGVRTAMRTFCDPEDDLFVVEAGATGQRLPLTKVVLRRPVHEALPGTVPRFSAAGNRIWVDYRFTNNFRYVVMAQIDGATFDVTRRKEEIEARLRRTADKLTVTVTCATCLETEDPLALARATLNTANAARTRRANRKRWQTFWNRSAVRVDDDILENLYTFNQYAFNCTHGCGMKAKYKAAGLYGLWPEADSMQWSNHVYCDANIQMAYQHAFSSNHLEQFEAFTDMVWAHLPTAQAMAHKVFNRPGACFGEKYFCAGPWYGSLLWDFYTHTGDLDYLRDKAYPVMKEAAEFSIGMMERGPDGRYYLFGDIPPERTDITRDRPDAMGFDGYYKNVTISLVFIKSLLKHLVQAARALKIDRDLVAQWREVLQHFPEYHTGETEFGQAIFDAAEYDKPYVTHHAPTTAVVYPTSELHLSSPKKQADLGRATVRSAWKYCQYRYTFTVPWVAAAMARMGLGDETEELLRKWSADVLTDPSGFMGRELGSRYAPWIDGDYGHRPGNAPLLEVGCGLLSVVNEMLLQERDGTVFVFPALPTKWRHAAFHDLRIPGGFLVSAEQVRGEVRSITVRAERGGNLTVRNPWKCGAVQEGGTGGRKTCRGDIGLDLAPGQTVRLRSQRPVRRRLPAPEGASQPKSRVTAQGFHLMLGMSEATRLVDAVQRFCFPTTIVRSNQLMALQSLLPADTYMRIPLEIPKDVYFNFDFGAKPSEDYAGWFGAGPKVDFVPVTCETDYDRGHQCGWEKRGRLSCVCAGGKDPLSRTAIRSTQPATFTLELNEGFYQCLLIHGAGPKIRTRVTVPGNSATFAFRAPACRPGIDEFGFHVSRDQAVPIVFRSERGHSWQVHALLVKRSW